MTPSAAQAQSACQKTHTVRIPGDGHSTNSGWVRTKNTRPVKILGVNYIEYEEQIIYYWEQNVRQVGNNGVLCDLRTEKNRTGSNTRWRRNVPGSY